MGGGKKGEEGEGRAKGGWKGKKKGGKGKAKEKTSGRRGG